MQNYFLALHLLLLSTSIFASENNYIVDPGEPEIVTLHNLDENIYEIKRVPKGQEKEQRYLSTNGKELFIHINQFDFESLKVACNLLLNEHFKLTQDDLNYNFLQFFSRWNSSNFQNLQNYNQLDMLFVHLVNLFIRHNVDVNCRTQHLETPLLLVNISDKVQRFSTTNIEFNYLLTKAPGIIIDACDEDNKTPLWWTVRWDNQTGAKMLLNNKANPNHRIGTNKDFSYIIHAAQTIEMVNILVGYGANPLVYNSFNETRKMRLINYQKPELKDFINKLSKIEKKYLKKHASDKLLLTEESLQSSNFAYYQ
ncbi:MAG: hypothetical protein P4L22_03125 [Candidatus Babeliales bacterium]|nr:hypothetical protein [Candidatus Babeliales bacterium]